MQYSKVKNVAKRIECKGPRLAKTILDTMKVCSDVVGGTLGPGGQPVLIERQELNMPNMVTKDGVTTFRSLGFYDPVQHAIMETARDASVRTASEAGDGTTTATVLSEAIVRLMQKYCADNPKVSPQKVVRKLEKVYREIVEPALVDQAIGASTNGKKGRKLLHNVARLSANGDDDLAAAVMECFDLVGDDGNVTIMELSGPSSYEVEHVEGYPIGMGYEDSCANFYPKFINDPERQMCVLEKPFFVLYHGRITTIQTVVNLMEKIADSWQHSDTPHNVVLVATGYSEPVIAQLAANFVEKQTINVFPLVTPRSPIANGQLHFLEDLAAVTGAKIFDPINEVLDKGEITDLGIVRSDENDQGVFAFECGRYRATVLGYGDEMLLADRAAALKAQMANAESILEKTFLEERIGKITGGIAKLKVIGASNGELREKRDRADDAVCAVRGAIKFGALPGGGWSLIKVAEKLAELKDDAIDKVLRPALLAPVFKIFENCGYHDEEIQDILAPIFDSAKNHDAKDALVFDALEAKHVKAVEGGILDSAPAVIEAIRNSISVAALLGTLGGCVVYFRDDELERREAQESNAFLRDAGTNPADERA